jgi:hypothetical protein
MADEDRDWKSDGPIHGSTEASQQLDDRTVRVSVVSLPIAGAELDRALGRPDGFAHPAANGHRAVAATATVREDSPVRRGRGAEESFVHPGRGLLDRVSWRARGVDDGS